MEYTIRGVPAQLITDVWRFAEVYVERALSHTNGEVKASDIRGWCESRDAQLWMILKESKVIGAGTTTIVNYPQMKVCRIITLSGSDFDDWYTMAHAQIELWAESQGCFDMEAFVRRGFVPKLAELGYKNRYSVVHKSLKKGK